MIKKITIGLSLLICGTVQSQQAESYLHFNVGAGSNTLSYPLSEGALKDKLGYSFNAAYSYFFSPQWGFQTGVGLQSFCGLSTFNYLSSSPQVDSDGASYIFNANFKNWKEKQQAILLDIPFAFQNKLALGKKFALLTTVGAKVSIPLHATYNTLGGDIKTTSYYPQWDSELTDLPQHGISIYSNTYSGNLTLKPAYSTIVELGGLCRLSKNVDLYIGGYFNYGLNSIAKSDTKLMYQPDGVYNSVFTSAQINKVNPIAVGAKIGIYFKCGNIKLAKELPKKKDTVSKNNILKDDVLKTDSLKAIEAANLMLLNKASLSDSTAVVVSKMYEMLKNGVGERHLWALAVPADLAQIENQFEEAKKIAASINVHFALLSDQLGNSQDDKIRALGLILKANPDFCLHIVGHTCNIGSYEINLRYGMKRAYNARQKFLDENIPLNQLIIESRAYEESLVPNTSAENRRKNRRVEIEVLTKNPRHQLWAPRPLGDIFLQK